MRTDDELSRLLRKLETDAEPDRATLDRALAGIDAERRRRLRSARRGWWRALGWPLAPPGLRLALAGVMAAILLSLTFGLAIGPFASHATPTPTTGLSAVPSATAPAALRPSPTEIVPTARISLTGRPYTVVAAAGAIWVADGNQVDRIDPASNRITKSISAGSGRACIGAGPAGIWVCDFEDGTVARLDPAAGTLGPKIAVQLPEFIAVGASDVWVASPRTALVTRIDPATNRVIASIDGGKSPSQLVATPDAVWVPNDQSFFDTASAATDRLVTRLDPATNTLAAVIDPGVYNGSYARQVIVVAGHIWVMDDNAGEIFVIDPATNAIVREIPIGRHIGGMVQIGDAVWVTIQDSVEGALVVRVDLATSTVTTALRVTGTVASTTGVTSITTLGTSLWVTADWSDGPQLLRIDPP